MIPSGGRPVSSSGKIHAPPLVLARDADVLTPPRFASALADRIGGTTLVAVPGRGHVLPAEASGALASTMRRFVRNL